MGRITNSLFLVATGCLIATCSINESEKTTTESTALVQETNGGTLFIIGGGFRPNSLMKKLLETVGDSTVSAAVLTMASAEPDSAWWYLRRDLKEAGFNQVWHFDTRNKLVEQTIDSLRNARLVFISGGDQSAFLRRADTLNIIPAIHEAFNSGAVVAGTSAGAALMSKVMITGDQLKDSVYESTYSRLAANNAVYTEGLGLLEQAIIDQHFIERSRYNRMFTALHDFPETTVIGIAESTAIIVRGKMAEVTGTGQVVIGKLSGKTSANSKDLLLFEEIQLVVLADGEQFNVTP